MLLPLHALRRRRRRRRLASAERRSRSFHVALNFLCGRVPASKHALRDPSYLLERRHGLAEIVERGANRARPGVPILIRCGELLGRATVSPLLSRVRSGLKEVWFRPAPIKPV